MIAWKKLSVHGLFLKFQENLGCDANCDANYLTASLKGSTIQPFHGLHWICQVIPFPELIGNDICACGAAKFAFKFSTESSRWRQRVKISLPAV
jgi:hypothetical protein